MLRPFSVLLLFALALAAVRPAPAQNAQAEPIRIGMSKSIFVDIPPILVQLFAPSFNDLCKQCTGMDAEMVVGGDPFELSRKLRAGELQVACYQGVEYAWAASKYDDIVPLMVAVNRHKNLKAHLVVRKDNAATDFAGLRGKEFALPLKSKEHCRLFLDRGCTDAGQCDAKTFFSQVTRPGGTEAALDDVCSGRVAATIVETTAVENYESIKPGCFARLKVIRSSETFPVAAIAYRKGAVSEAVLNKFRDGMVNANKNERTRELMNVYQITAFEPVPPDYARTCADIIKAYPAPDVSKVSRN